MKSFANPSNTEILDIEASRDSGVCEGLPHAVAAVPLDQRIAVVSSYGGPGLKLGWVAGRGCGLGGALDIRAR